MVVFGAKAEYPESVISVMGAGAELKFIAVHRSPEITSWVPSGAETTICKTFFFRAALFFSGPLDSNSWFCRSRGMILKHFAPKNEEIGDLEASVAHFEVGKASYVAESPVLLQ